MRVPCPHSAEEDCSLLLLLRPRALSGIPHRRWRRARRPGGAPRPRWPRPRCSCCSCYRRRRSASRRRRRRRLGRGGVRAAPPIHTPLSHPAAAARFPRRRRSGWASSTARCTSKRRRLRRKHRSATSSRFWIGSGPARTVPSTSRASFRGMMMVAKASDRGTPSPSERGRWTSCGRWPRRQAQKGRRRTGGEEKEKLEG